VAAQVRLAVEESKFTVNRQVAALSRGNPGVSSAFLLFFGSLPFLSLSLSYVIISPSYCRIRDYIVSILRGFPRHRAAHSPRGICRISHTDQCLCSAETQTAPLTFSTDIPLDDHGDGFSNPRKNVEIVVQIVVKRHLLTSVPALL